jgi:hypothetical protein
MVEIEGLKVDEYFVFLPKQDFKLEYVNFVNVISLKNNFRKRK